MSWRRVPPVFSPVPASAVLAGAVAGLGARGRLSRHLASEYGADRVVLTDRGTTALQLAMQLATADGAGIIALPAFACYDLATAAVGADLRVALYDVDPVTLGPDMDSLAAAFRAGAAAAVIAIPFGYAPDWPALEALAERHSARLIEDAAQGHGGRLGDRPLGALGSLSVLSFGRGKGWTGGSGGALLLRGAAAEAGPALRRARPGGSIGTTAKAGLQALAGRPPAYTIPASIPWLGLGETHYREPSTPARMQAAAAAILLASGGAALREAERRRRNGAAWAERLHAGSGLSLLDPVAGSRPGYLRFPLRITEGRRASALADWRTFGMALTYPTTLAELGVIRERRVENQELPGATTLVHELVTLPTHRYVRLVDADRMGKLLSRSSWPAVARATSLQGESTS